MTATMLRSAVPVAVKRPIRRFVERVVVNDRIHMLHIGKTGGTALKHALEAAEFGPRRRMVMHGHEVGLADIPVGDGVIFVVRDPISRFVSGFHSRQRQGRPRYFSPWKAGEAEAFARFETPEALALALGSDDPSERDAAVAAMADIRHVRDRLSGWLGSPELLRARREDVVFAGRVETLDADIGRLAIRLGLDALELPTDATAAHRSPVRPEPLSTRAIALLEDWYADDVELVAEVDRMRQAEGSS